MGGSLYIHYGLGPPEQSGCGMPIALSQVPKAFSQGDV